MARRPSRTASSTSSSGALAPSRKLYAECACNSAYPTDERIGRPSSGGWYAIRLRDQGASSAGVHTVGVPERRGLPESTRSISDQPGGPLLKPTRFSLSNIRSNSSSVLPAPLFPESIHGLGVHVVVSERGQSSWRS